mmetsp:Transcript_36585/g.84118  ORF Transcript_36585/g.84118 Transcript_36585/m.84118 type:complete len:155 (+) Transcript_36585:24-488(+)
MADFGLRVGHAGSYTVIEQSGDGWVVELETGERGILRLRTSQQAHSTPTSAPRSAGRGLAYTVPVWVQEKRAQAASSLTLPTSQQEWRTSANAQVASPVISADGSAAEVVGDQEVQIHGEAHGAVENEWEEYTDPATGKRWQYHPRTEQSRWMD